MSNLTTGMKQMQYRKNILFLIAISLLLAAPLIIEAQQNPAVEPAPLRSLAELLPDRLAGVSATGEVVEHGHEGLENLVAEKAAVYREYLVISAASRQYGEVRVDIFQTENPYAAFGLFTYNSGARESKAKKPDARTGSVLMPGESISWKDDVFIRVTATAEQARGSTFAHYERLASAIVAAIVPSRPDLTRPPLLESLPVDGTVADSERYFLGPESLSRYIEHSRNLFEFAGKAEAALAEYEPGEAAPASAVRDSPKARGEASAEEEKSRTKLFIVEYHTPQFASDAMKRASDYLRSLPEDEQNRIIIKREGNYIVGAASFHDRERARGLVDSVKYPYEVKWLRDPLIPTGDPFHMQKAAQMLLSSFGLIGIGMLTALVVGTAFGATIFLKRRKRLQEIFSDGGNMLRLEVDPFEKVILGLPPRKDEG